MALSLEFLKWDMAGNEESLQDVKLSEKFSEKKWNKH